MKSKTMGKITSCSIEHIEGDELPHRVSFIMDDDNQITVAAEKLEDAMLTAVNMALDYIHHSSNNLGVEES